MIPNWNLAGVIPPIRPGVEGHSPDRSPYRVDIVSFVNFFAFNAKRIEILDGFLRYRKELYAIGITSGFQWVDGSFSQHVELTDLRSPNDIDVVTFFHTPNGESQIEFMPKCEYFFTPDETKRDFFVDAYPIILGHEMNASRIRSISYWYSMWSHRTKDNLWKGFCEIPLSPDLDLIAKQDLARRLT
jgi:hypothetical protein